MQAYYSTVVTGGGDSLLQTDVELDTLLDAKFAIPRQRQAVVSRAHLIEAARASERRAVAITAPAGYGKSTLLTDWARHETRAVAYVGLDRFDDDPSALIAALAATYVRMRPNRTALVTGISGPGMSVLGRSAPRFAALLASDEAPFVLMLDDLHELRSPDCHDVLGVVLAGIPKGSQLVTASRSEQPHVGFTRARGEVYELRTIDLALDAGGAALIFADARTALTPERAAHVIERTEGWPVGLQLAALIERESPENGSGVSGDDRYVADYLYHETLARLPEPMRQFLRRTAVLDQLSAPLCDAVMGEPGSQALLVELEASNLFLVPLDRRRGWFRHHALFREFLLAELERAEPDSIETYHRRAADWYEQHGSPALALEHMLKAGETQRSVRLVTQLVLPTYQAGQVSTVQRWLATLGDDAISGYPPLAVLATWIALLTGHVVETHRLAAVIDQMSFAGETSDGTASFRSARAMVRAAMCAGGAQQMLADAATAVAEEPPWSPWRDTALYLNGEALLLQDDKAGAADLFAEASELGQTSGNADNVVLCESELALLAIGSGRWGEAGDHVARAMDAIDTHHMQDYVTSVIAFAAAARTALHAGDEDTAVRRATQAMRARPVLNSTVPYVAVRVRLELARVHAALGDHAAAKHLLKEADDLRLHSPSLGVLVEQSEQLRAALEHATAPSATASPLTPAELRLLPYLQTHLTMAEIGERLFVSRNTISTQVGSVYRKLGVSSRSDAVARSTALGLLGG